jgi:hypothetical protein
MPLVHLIASKPWYLQATFRHVAPLAKFHKLYAYTLSSEGNLLRQVVPVRRINALALAGRRLRQPNPIRPSDLAPLTETTAEVRARKLTVEFLPSPAVANSTSRRQFALEPASTRPVKVAVVAQGLPVTSNAFAAAEVQNAPTPIVVAQLGAQPPAPAGRGSDKSIAGIPSTPRHRSPV